MFFILALIIIVVALIICNIRIVPQSNAVNIERLGIYSHTWGAGLHVKTPFIDRMGKNISLKEQVADFPPQPVITKDNVTMQIDTVVYYQITDPKLYAYGIEQPLVAIENLTATTLRNIVGGLELDQCLTSRDTINTQMRAILDEATDPWGIKVNRVELKNILPPKEVQSAMEKQMKAEREKREAITIAEANKTSIVLEATGKKEAAELQAEAQKTMKIREAEGHAESIRLHKEAEANGMRQLRQAEADGIRMLREAGLSNEDIMKLKSLEAFTAAADGRATKLIIPSNIQNLAGVISEIKAVASESAGDTPVDDAMPAELESAEAPEKEEAAD